MDSTAVLGTPAVSDSLHAVLVVRDFLVGAVPWLSTDVVDVFARILTSSGILVTILAWEKTGLLLARFNPIIAAATTKFGALSFLINPLLGMLLGQMAGDWQLGGVAGTIWGATMSGMKRARGAAVVIASLGALAVASNASAAALSIGDHGTFALGAGYEQRVRLNSESTPVLLLQPGWTLSNHISLRARYVWPIRTLDRDAGERWEATVWYVF